MESFNSACETNLGVIILQEVQLLRRELKSEVEKLRCLFHLVSSNELAKSPGLNSYPETVSKHDTSNNYQQTVQSERKLCFNKQTESQHSVEEEESPVIMKDLQDYVDPKDRHCTEEQLTSTSSCLFSTKSAVSICQKDQNVSQSNLVQYVSSSLPVDTKLTSSKAAVSPQPHDRFCTSQLPEDNSFPVCVSNYSCGKSVDYGSYINTHSSTLHKQRSHLELPLSGTSIAVMSCGKKTMCSSIISFSCHICCKQFLSQEKLEMHLRAHTGEKPFECSQCGKMFGQRQYLECHWRTHTGEKPFRCEICGKSFAQKANLSRHMITHTGDRPFSCSQCGKSFALKQNLIRHVQIHDGPKQLSCEYCNWKFIHEKDFQNHMRLHTGEKPFTCLVCGESFMWERNLNAHMHIHSQM